MSYLVGEDRYQSTFMPHSLDELINENNAVRVIDAFVDSVDLEGLGFVVYQGTNPGQESYKRDDFTGYYNQQQILECSDDTTEILIKKRVKEAGKIKACDTENYKYMSETDSYICPDGYVVLFHSKFKKGGHSLRKYQCHECMNCINKLSCTTSKVMNYKQTRNLL